jgi:hypothetical protein
MKYTNALKPMLGPLAACLIFAGCGNGNTGNDLGGQDAANDTTPTDVVDDSHQLDTRDDTTGRDGTATDDGGQDTGDDVAGDTATDDGAVDVPDDNGGDTVNPTDFVIRKPAAEALECTSTMGGDNYFIGQIDYFCHIENTALTADLYIQTEPTDCGQWGNPTYTEQNTWIKVGGTVSKIDGGYEYGGRHHNDYISFTWAGTMYYIGYSSLGYGGRVCTTPHCLEVCKPGQECPLCELGKSCAADTTGLVANNGCARTAGGMAPPLLAICVQVNSDGTLPELQDPWTTLSPYGENGEMILPCLGENDMGF